jgi:hypothetical protein
MEMALSDGVLRCNNQVRAIEGSTPSQVCLWTGGDGRRHIEHASGSSSITSID